MIQFRTKYGGKTNKGPKENFERLSETGTTVEEYFFYYQKKKRIVLVEGPVVQNGYEPTAYVPVDV